MLMTLVYLGRGLGPWTRCVLGGSPCLKSKVPHVGNGPFMEIVNMSKQNSTGKSWIESSNASRLYIDKQMERLA
jgi:hypothetical protein